MLELALLVRIGGMIGLWNTMLIVVGTGLLGSYLARREGFSVWGRVNAKIVSGQIPGEELLDGAIILVSAALLVTPGVVTDIVGFMGLLPPTRAVIKRILRKRFSQGAMSRRVGARVSFGGGGFQAGQPFPFGSDAPRRARDENDISGIVEDLESTNGPL